MSNNGINIRIEKNNYNKGALNFQIFNPETDDYDEVNAFSDENQLLKFTSETRDLSEYAYDFIKTLLNTYKRMNGIQLEFFGSSSDYEVLQKALDFYTDDTKYYINPHCYIEPDALVKYINSYIAEANNIIDSAELKDICSEYNEKTEKLIAFYRVKLITDEKALSDPKGLKLETNNRVSCIASFIEQIIAMREFFEAEQQKKAREIKPVDKKKVSLIRSRIHGKYMLPRNYQYSITESLLNASAEVLIEQTNSKSEKKMKEIVVDWFVQNESTILNTVWDEGYKTAIGATKDFFELPSDMKMPDNLIAFSTRMRIIEESVLYTLYPNLKPNFKPVDLFPVVNLATTIGTARRKKDLTINHIKDISNNMIKRYIEEMDEAIIDLVAGMYEDSFLKSEIEKISIYKFQLEFLSNAENKLKKQKQNIEIQLSNVQKDGENE